MSDAFRSQFISSYQPTGNVNEAPDLYYRHNKDLVDVYSRDKNNELISKVTTADLCDIAHEQTLFITHVRDATFERKPIIIIVTTTTDSVEEPLTTKPCLYVFWHSILKEVTHLIHFDLPMVGGVSMVALTSHPLTMVKNTVREIKKEEHLRHLLVFGKHDQSVQVALIHDAGNGRIRGQVTQAELPSQVSGDITAIHVLTQDIHDRRLGFNDPRILVGTSNGYIQVLRFQAVFKRQNTKGGIHIVSAQTLTEFTKQHQEPITYLTCERVPGNRKIIAAVGQKSKSITPSSPLDDSNDWDKDSNENAHLYVIEWYGNHRRRISERLTPSKLTSYSVCSTRIIPTETDFLITTIFQSTEEKHRYEVDVWSVEERKPNQLISDEIVESDAKHSLEDMWPIQGTSRYMLLYPEKIIESTSTSADKDFFSKTQLEAPKDIEQKSNAIPDSETIAPSMRPSLDDDNKENDSNTSSDDALGERVGNALEKSMETKDQQSHDTELKLTENSEDTANLDLDKDDQGDAGLELTENPEDTTKLDLHKDDQDDGQSHNLDLELTKGPEVTADLNMDTDDQGDEQSHNLDMKLAKTPEDTANLDLDKDDQGDAELELTENPEDTTKVDLDTDDQGDEQSHNLDMELAQTPEDTGDLVMDTDDQGDEQSHDAELELAQKPEDITNLNLDKDDQGDEQSHDAELELAQKPEDITNLDLDKDDQGDEQSHNFDMELTKDPEVTADLDMDKDDQFDEQQDSNAHGPVSNENIKASDSQENGQSTGYNAKAAETTVAPICNELEMENDMVTTAISDNVNKIEADAEENDMYDGLKQRDIDHGNTVVTCQVGLEVNSSGTLNELDHSSKDEIDIQSEEININQQALTFIGKGSADSRIEADEMIRLGNANDDQYYKMLISIQQGETDELENTIQMDSSPLEADITGHKSSLIGNALTKDNTNTIDDEADPSLANENCTESDVNDYEPIIFDDDVSNDISTSNPISMTKSIDSFTTSAETISPDPPTLTSYQKDIVEEEHTPKMIYEAKVKEVTDISLSDGLNMVRKDEANGFSQYERLNIFFDIIFASSTTRDVMAAETSLSPAFLDIDKAIKTLEDLSLNDVEEDWLMGYCYNNKEHPLLKLVIMRYNIKHKRYRLVMLQHQTMGSEEKNRRHDPETNRNDPKAALVDRVNRSCNNLAKLSQKMEPAILQDLPLEIFARPRGKVGNPFLNQQGPTSHKGFGAEILYQALARKRRRIL